VHGAVYVVDASDIERLDETRLTFFDSIQDSFLAGKPILMYNVHCMRASYSK